MQTQPISPLARQAIALGRERHWRFRVVGTGDVPEEPIYSSGWWFTKAPEAPQIASDRLSALSAAGIQVAGILIAHEAPKILTDPGPKPKMSPRKIVSEPSRSKGILTTLVSALGAVFVTILMAIPELLISAILVDPAIIAVLSDGTWLEVVNYYE